MEHVGEEDLSKVKTILMVEASEQHNPTLQLPSHG
jgi:hypothetical protein